MSDDRSEFLIGFISALSFVIVSIPITIYVIDTYNNYYFSFMTILASALLLSFVVYLFNNRSNKVLKAMNSDKSKDQNLRKILNRKYIENKITTDEYEDSISNLNEIEKTIGDRPAENNHTEQEFEKDFS